MWWDSIQCREYSLYIVINHNLKCDFILFIRSNAHKTSCIRRSSVVVSVHLFARKQNVRFRRQMMKRLQRPRLRNPLHWTNWSEDCWRFWLSIKVFYCDVVPASSPRTFLLCIQSDGRRISSTKGENCTQCFNSLLFLMFQNNILNFRNCVTNLKNLMKYYRYVMSVSTEHEAKDGGNWMNCNVLNFLAGRKIT